MKTVRRTLILALLAFLVCGLVFAGPAGAATKAQIDTATTNGVNYLVAQQSTGGAPSGAWPGDSFYAANTGFAVAVLEHQAEKLGKNPLDPSYAYAANVQNGLDYLFSSATYDAANQWVYWNDPSFYNSYQTGPCLMAIARSGAPTATVSGGALNGFTYLQVAQMTVDWLASAQTTTGDGTGAWYYSKGYADGDQSATGWVTMGLGYAAHSMGCTLPADLLTRLSTWNDFIQSHTPGPDFGGAAYTSGYAGWYNVYKTGHLLFAQGLCGDTVATQRVQDALTFMTAHWSDLTNGANSSDDYGWRGNPPGVLPSYIATAAAMKGFTELGIETFNGIDWYKDFTDVIVANQWPDGHWLGGGHGENDHRSTCWALLTLLKATSRFTLTYVAGEHGTIVGTTPQTVDFEGSGTEVTAVADSGYHFVSWSDGITTAARTDTNVTADHTFTATFAQDITSPPVPRPLPGYSTVVVKPGGWATILYTVRDSYSATAHVTLKILASGAASRSQLPGLRALHVVKTIDLGTKRTNTRLKAHFVCRLKVGVYRYHILAKSASGLRGSYLKGYLAVGDKPRAWIEGASGVTSGGTFSMRYLLVDPYAQKARVKVYIMLPAKAAGGAAWGSSTANEVVKVFNLGVRRTNVVGTAAFRCTVKPGLYRWAVYARDSVGATIRSGTNLLWVW